LKKKIQIDNKNKNKVETTSQQSCERKAWENPFQALCSDELFHVTLWQKDVAGCKLEVFKQIFSQTQCKVL